MTVFTALYHISIDVLYKLDTLIPVGLKNPLCMGRGSGGMWESGYPHPSKWGGGGGGVESGIGG